MKNIITIILLLLNIAGYSQASAYPRIYFWEASSDTVNLGDSLYWGFKYIPATDAPYYTSCSFQLMGATTTILWSGDVFDLDTLPKYEYSPTDSLSKIYFHIPTGITPGSYTIYASGIGTPNNHPVYVVNPFAGINDISKTKQIKEISYFNLSGQQITKETAGIKIKRITFSDNSIGYQKEFGL